MAIARFYCAACKLTVIFSVEGTAEALEMDSYCEECGGRLAWREVDHIGEDPSKDRLYLRRYPDEEDS